MDEWLTEQAAPRVASGNARPNGFVSEAFFNWYERVWDAVTRGVVCLRVVSWRGLMTVAGIGTR